ncbi:AAA family ATPase [Enterococcus larvae]|uniref:AAA family ATPase n=1 Tax=Enterococcus larvae TaxID=2794352 RepID=UPI003F318C47
MKIDSIEIKNIGPIDELKLNFTPRLNVICGTNGIGKTTILETIAANFFGWERTVRIRKKYNTINSNFIVNSKDDKRNDRNMKVVGYHPFEYAIQDSASHSQLDEAKEVIYFSVNREMAYKQVTSIPKDPLRDKFNSAELAQNGLNSEDLKAWLIKRYLIMGRPEMLSGYEKRNYELAIEAFNKIDPNVKFSHVENQTFEILVKDKENMVYLEYLSSGYKTCLFMILGIITEIEFRYYDNKINIEEYEGLVLIDEIDLHLHPIWQSKIIQILKNTFPNVQFIITSHSPHVIQNLAADEIIALEYNEKNKIQLKELQLNGYGLQGWTVNEILEDVMGMKETQTSLLTETMDAFESALNEENEACIKESYAVLNNLLHPNSPLRKIIEIQKAGWS